MTDQETIADLSRKLEESRLAKNRILNEYATDYRRILRERDCYRHMYINTYWKHYHFYPSKEDEEWDDRYVNEK